MEMSRLTREGTAKTVSQDQILRHARGQGNMNFPISAHHEQDWQPYPVDSHYTHCCLKKNQNAPRPSEHPLVVVVVFFTLTDRASTIPNNTRGCQSGTWSAGQKKIRGTSTKLQ